MRTRAGVTAGVAVLSVLASAAGHAFVAGHPVAADALPRLGLLASLCFLLSAQRLGTPGLVGALSLVQVGVHVVLMTGHTPHVDHTMQHMHQHHMAMPAEQPAGAGLPMLAMHLGAMLGTLWLLRAAARWWERLVSALGRVLPRLPRLAGAVPVPHASAAYGVVPTPHPQRWLPSTVRRRGPPSV